MATAHLDTAVELDRSGRIEEWAGSVGQWNSRVLDDRLLRGVYVAPRQDQSWTPDAIQNSIVTRFDPVTRTVSWTA